MASKKKGDKQFINGYRSWANVCIIQFLCLFFILSFIIVPCFKRYEQFKIKKQINGGKEVLRGGTIKLIAVSKKVEKFIYLEATKGATIS